MEKNTLKKLSVSAALIATLAVGWDSLTLSNSEIQKYIEDSLALGCRPIVDICTNDCGSIEIDLKAAGVPESCIIPENEIIRVPFEKFSENYIEVGKKYGLKEQLAPNTPEKIRAEMQKRGKRVEPIKEVLIVK